MITIANGIILKGKDLTPSRENILIDDGKIITISKDILEGEIIDASGCVVSPSFINSHTHIGDSIIKDEGYGLSFDEIVKPPNGLKHLALKNAEDKDVIDAMKLSMYDMLRSGTTHFIDYREGGVKGIKLLKKASKDIPINPIILGRDDSFYGDDPDLKSVKIAIRKILKIADGIAPSGFNEITEEVAILISEECTKKCKLSSIHVGESIDSQKNSIKKYNASEIELGIKNNFNQLVHCTNPLKGDLDLIKNSNVSITLCFRSNAALRVGIPNLDDFFKKGIFPSIGTDNIMINSPNMLRELDFIFKLRQLNSKNYINPKEILKLATVNFSGKSIINEDNYCEIFISKKLSKNPYLSIINRIETKDIINIINKDDNIDI
ncbi:MAG: amidohydrolase family protein [Methanobacteriaceae archaeon]|jgi:cytosine/adenosine deaminase-related metal-dependent hydrolase|nr:amidohydrolase family protein [Methanobacteriaceae archaeon]